MNLSHLTTCSPVLQHSGSHIISSCLLVDGRWWVALAKQRHTKETVTTNLPQKCGVIWHKEPVCKSSATAELFCLPWRGGHPIENNPWQKQSRGHKAWSSQPLALPPHFHLSRLTQLFPWNGWLWHLHSPMLSSDCLSVPKRFSPSLFLTKGIYLVEGYLIVQDVSASFSATGGVRYLWL